MAQNVWQILDTMLSEKRKLLWISWLLCLTVIWLVFKYNLNWTFNKENTAEILALLQARSEWNGGLCGLFVRPIVACISFCGWIGLQIHGFTHLNSAGRQTQNVLLGAQEHCPRHCRVWLDSGEATFARYCCHCIVIVLWGHICNIVLSLYCRTRSNCPPIVARGARPHLLTSTGWSVRWSAGYVYMHLV